jgi:hypothetical protein
MTTPRPTLMFGLTLPALRMWCWVLGTRRRDSARPTSSSSLMPSPFPRPTPITTKTPQKARWHCGKLHDGGESRESKGIKGRQCFGSEPIVSHPTLFPPCPACRAVVTHRAPHVAVVEDDGSKPHATSCTSSGPPSDGVHRLRMADSQGAREMQTSAASQRLQGFRRQIMTRFGVAG